MARKYLQRKVFIAAVLIAVSGVLSPRAGIGGEYEVERLQLRSEKLEGQLKRIQSRLANAEKQRDAALRLAEDAKRQVDEALHQAADANSQRDAARKEAATERKRVAYQTTAIRQQAEREKNDIREQAKTDQTELRQQYAKVIDAIRNTANTQVEAAHNELARVCEQSEAYKTRMNRTESELRLYKEREEADRQLATHYYLQGIRYLEKRDNPNAIRSFTAAIEQYPQDARFFFLRAFVRHRTSESNDKLDDAIKDAKRGAELENLRDPEIRLVDRSLERYQGKSRIWLEKYRVLR